MKKYWFALCFAICFTVSLTGTVNACSGGANYVSLDDLQHADVVVDATVALVDQSGWNAVLEVHRYFKGSGSHYLPVSNYTFTQYNGYNVRGYDRGCIYPGHKWTRNTRAYIFLHVRQDGAYIERRQGYAEARFSVEHDLVTYYNGDQRELVTVSSTEFEDLLQATLNLEAPVESLWDSATPLMRTIRVTAESGAQAIVQYDRSVRLLDPHLDAFRVSPDGAHTAFRVDEDEIYITRQSQQIRDTNAYQWSGLIIPGQEVVFSPNSSLMAVLDQQSLFLYRFDNTGSSPGRGFPDMQVFPIGQAAFADSQHASDRQVVWSGNSSTVAYLDHAGIWMWNLYEQPAPILVVSREELETVFTFAELRLFELSLTGRYVRFGTASYWHLFDSYRNTPITNALINPDESRFAYINSGAVTEAQLNCATPMQINCPLLIQTNENLLGYTWVNGELATIACDEYCVSTRYMTDPIHIQRQSGGGWHRPLAVQLILDAKFHSNVLQLDDYRLEISSITPLDEIESWRPFIIDFSGMFDSPIRSIEWGLPLFYTPED
jgi:hypothetical protein